ncbi:LPS export ABC transporter permease LptF [Comamonas serinivorans]|uniref:Lipopolysaccharide export system permease protein LptF n=1 Tax=Comamonas serinivorans TaxID=1082851 RepID=A0A1Y0EPS6_9BURK|nr:LPS export ABC transporter permease LptF [Comamonas serinivorans]ARU05450.1 LPS export ABC transporter permease LptF [Comamonas serinivorans]
MLFDSTLRKELGRSFSATLVILATIVMTMMLIRTLGLASGGKVDPADVMLVMGFTVLGHLPTILTLSLFIAIVATLSRMYVQSEMVIWLSSGQSLLAFIRPLARFAAPVVVVIGLLALLAWPWANQQVQELRTHFQQRGDIDRVAAGQFQESANGERVFFIEKDASGKEQGSNIFIATRDAKSETVTSAQSGHLEVINGDRFLMLDKGQRTQIDLATGDLRISTFQQYGVVIATKVLDNTALQRPRAKSTAALLADPSAPNLGELSWRIGLMLAACNLVLLGVTAANGNARSGRTAGLIFALLAFVVYYNLLAFTQSWVSSGKIGIVPALVVLHGGVFTGVLAWLLLRNRRWSWRDLLPQPTPQAGPTA